MPLQAMTNPAEAASLIARLHDIPEVIGGLVPRGFPAYARVFAPISDGADKGNKTLTWEALSLSVGLRLNAETPWSAFSTETRTALQPLMGSLGPAASHLLAQTLLPHTATTSDCFFALWVGYGGIKIPSGASLMTFPPDREMIVFNGDLAFADENFEEEPFARQSIRWWPASKEWCVAGDIYSTSAVVGGSLAAIEAVRATQGLEVLSLSEDSSLRVEDL